MSQLSLYVWNAELLEKVPVYVAQAGDADFRSTAGWQTNWKSSVAQKMPNKVALHKADDKELLGLMSYELDRTGLAVEIIYIESAGHSNANLLKISGQRKKYIGIARALIAYAVQVSIDAGYDGVIYFKAKTDELCKYYMKEFGATPVGHYDPYRLVIWEDAAQDIISDFKEGEV